MTPSSHLASALLLEATDTDTQHKHRHRNRHRHMLRRTEAGAQTQMCGEHLQRQTPPPAPTAAQIPVVLVLDLIYS